MAITNKEILRQWVEDFGEDSDFVKVRVRGVFPSASSLQFISRDVVDQAMQRDAPSARGETTVVGVDPARFGNDCSVIFTRTGRDGRAWPPIRLRGVDTMQLASRVAEHVNFLRAAGCQVILNVDGALAVTFAVPVPIPMDDPIAMGGDEQAERQRREVLYFNPATGRGATLWTPR